MGGSEASAVIPIHASPIPWTSNEMIFLKSPDEIERMRYPARMVAEILAELARIAKPGVSTGHLEAISLRAIKKFGATSAFKGYAPFEGDTPFPASICTSLNCQVMNGIPSDKVILKNGDIITINLGLFYGGYAGDGAITVAVGEVSPEARRLIRVTHLALLEAIDFMKLPARIGDVGAGIQRFVEHHGYSVVRNQFGHGIGRDLHEEPAVPNYGKTGAGTKLEPGMVLSVKPIVNAGGGETRQPENSWASLTADGRLSCCFAHTIAVTERGLDILTDLR